MTAGDKEARGEPRADAEHLDPAYSSLEEQRADIAARERHFAEIESAIRGRADRIEAALHRLFKGAEAAEARRLAERYAAMAAIEPFPLARPPEAPAEKPRLTEVRVQIKALRDAAAAVRAGRRRSMFGLKQALAGISLDALALVLPAEREATTPRTQHGTGKAALHIGLAVWAKVRAEGGDVPEIDPALLVAGAEDALRQMGDVRAKPGPKPDIDPVAIALMLSHDLRRLSGHRENVPKKTPGPGFQRHWNRVSAVLNTIFPEIGVTESPVEVARRAAEADPTRPRRTRR